MMGYIVFIARILQCGKRFIQIYSSKATTMIQKNSTIMASINGETKTK
jgi:hypothetical protein